MTKKISDPEKPNFELYITKNKYFKDNFAPVGIISANVGFVTNSSSVIYHFPKEILEDEEVKKFIEDYGLEHGFVGNDLWHRDGCTTLALTKDQKHYVNLGLKGDNEDDYSFYNVSVNEESDEIVLIYGDEYESIVHTLARLMKDVANRKKISFTSTDYN